MTKSDKKLKLAWPTKDVMTQIYKKHLWGGENFDFYSGEGSHKPEIIQPYLSAVITFLKGYNNQLSICDLGCGDFNIGKELSHYSSSYIGVDIVEDLISRNKTLFQSEKIDFTCLDMAKDTLPKADCAILRQVLQHLSNSEIKSIINKLRAYKFFILTEHIPTSDFTANIDMVSCQGNRLKYNSGVDITKPPFSFEFSKKELLNLVVLPKGKGEIKTYLFEA